jgi:hypothetical protein
MDVATAIGRLEAAGAEQYRAISIDRTWNRRLASASA